MPEENVFDKLSKRLAVSVSRRSLFRSLSLAVAGAFLPWSKAIADFKLVTSLELETNFLAGPTIVELRIGSNLELRCLAAVKVKVSDSTAFGAASAREGTCPADVASYFENTDIRTKVQKMALFDNSKMFQVRVIEGRSYLLKTFPIAHVYSAVNPTTGKEEVEAFCTVATYLDPRVHKNQVDQKVIYYKRMPTPKQLTSLDTEVTCGDINEAYENEIKTRQPIAIRDFTVDAIPHQTSAKRVNATGTSIRNHSGHKSK